MKFLALSFVLLCAPGALLDFAAKQWESVPAFEMQDAYKWLFQATRGGEHAAPSYEAAQKWLDGEWKTLGKPQENELLWEPLCQDDSIGRLNLRPFRAQGGKIETALTAFIESAKNFGTGEKSKENFQKAWVELGKKLKKKPAGKLNHAEWTKLDEEMRAKDYPAVHHSKAYGEAHIPAYRIITDEQARKVLAELKKN